MIRIRVRKSLIIFRKDLDDFTKSKYVLLSMIFMPLLFALLIPASSVLPLMFADADEITSSGEMDFINNFALTDDWENLDERQRLFVFTVEMSLFFFLMLPVVMPTIIASDSFAGEKDRGTVEGLVVAPLTNMEIYVGKILGALIPSVASTWGASLVFAIIVNWAALDIMGRLYLPNLNFILFVGIVGPLLGLATTNIMIWISTKTSSSRDAQQLGSLFALPLILFLLASFGVALVFSTVIVFFSIIFLTLVVIQMSRWGSQILDRERWVSLV